jgi:superfamily II DNA or RNA helicase
MIGLYLLTTCLLENLKTVKFGMSMRIEYRWIDYLSIFNDSKYIYYYEFLDNLTRTQILEIEDVILQLYKKDRNYLFQTEYFYCSDYLEFHKTIVNILDSLKINYKIHDTHNFTREYYDNKPEPFNYEPLIIKKQEENNTITPYPYQQSVLDKIDDFYKSNNIGKIIHCCGLGKALLGLLITQKLNYKLVLIGVPSIYLQKQMKNEILRLFNYSNNILYVGGETEYNQNYTIPSTTSNDVINNFINQNSNSIKFIITTYSSCKALTEDYCFDFKIGDEAHHLVGTEYENTKNAFHSIKSKKTLFMTATEKSFENNKNNKIIYSMDDTTIFGQCIDSKSIKWAIENKKITDYKLVIIKNTEHEIDLIINSLNISNNIQNLIKTNKDLFLSAFMSLKSMEKYTDLTHILIYTNKTENAELVNNFVNIILDLKIMNIDNKNFYNKAIHSNSKEILIDIKSSDDKIIEGELTKFKKASKGIISSVYIFGEGFDCPRLNGVVFAENMESDIRIVQSTLRPNRLDRNFPHKEAYVIIPYIDTKNFIDDTSSFDKCRKIIAKIRNADETMEQKIHVLSLDKSISNNSNECITEPLNLNNIIENKDELNKIILRLRYSKALNSTCTEEQDEFNYIRELNKELNILDKEDYTNDPDVKKNHKMYIPNPDTYFTSKGVWTNWYDFLGINTDKFIQDKNDWIHFCKEKNVKSIDDYKKLCQINEQLPRNPSEFYKHFSNILSELRINSSRR